ncbi:MAG: serine/threonine-protein kinase, partial [Bacteroidota bacterium]
MILKGKSDNYILDKEDANSFVNSKGKISTVFTGIRESDKQQVVIKEINLKTSIESIDLLIKEGEFRFNHINLVQTFDHVIIDSKLYIIREYIAGIDLKNLILSRKTRKKTSTDFFLKCGIQVCDALEYLHQENTIHCDIKPSNIIVCKNSDNYDFNNPVIKLIDYGFSTDQSSKNKIFEKQTFALMYSPPEQLLKIYSLINETSDIYSLGITLYELITGKNPFYSENPLKIMTLQ